MGLGTWDYAWSVHVEPNGERVVACVGAQVAVVRVADGAVEATRRVPDRQVQGWTRRGIVLSDASARTTLWDPPSRPRGAILPGADISPSGRWRFDYDADADRITVWFDDESPRTVEGIRGPHVDRPYHSRGFFEEGIAWITGWHEENVLVSLTTGRSQLLLPFVLGAPEVFFVASRMVFVSGGDGWLVAHAEHDGVSILDATASGNVGSSR